MFFEVSGALPTSVSPPSPRKTPSPGDGCRKGSSGPGEGGRSAASLVQEVGWKDELGAEDCEVHAWAFFRKSMENAFSF